MRLLFLTIMFFWGWLFVDTDQPEMSMQEICDNGIDDDMDGLVDLNDTTDCICEGISDIIFRPSSLIPNPSFEDTLCCPQGLAQLSCAADWIQASSATSDYFHTCGFSDDRDRGFPPMPLPAGDAYVGFLDIQGIFGNQYKEYVGACLNEPMKAGTEYTLQFYLGFGRAGRIYSARSPVTIVIYGTNDCAQLPFGGANYQDCPSKLPGWFEIDRVTLRGVNEWIRAMMMFTPPSDVAAVAIGTSCNRSTGFYYYFLDDLVLNESEEFENVKLDMTGDICDDFVTLSANSIPTLTYQWYRNGVAISGATNSELILNKQDTGTYIVRLSDSLDCELSLPLEYYPEVYTAVVDTTICQGEMVMIEGLIIDSSYSGEVSYPANLYCDSIIQIEVTLLDSSVNRIDTSICSAQSITVAGQQYSQPGEYRLVIDNYLGCDSIIYLDLAQEDTVQLSLDTTICLGEFVTINGQQLEGGVHFQNFQNAEGCEVMLEVVVQERDTFMFVKDTALCAGAALMQGGPVINSGGRYPFAYQTQHGCDSTMIYRVTLRDTFRTIVDTSVCAGDTIFLGGISVFGPTKLIVDEVSENTCDSTVVYNVIERAPYFERIDTMLCPDEFIVFRGDTLIVEDVYAFSVTGTTTCDSTWEMALQFREPVITELDSQICFGESILWEGQTLDESGVYSIRKTSNFGCDSMVMMDLVILEDPNLEYEVLSPITCNGEDDGVVRIVSSDLDMQVLWTDGFVGQVRGDLGAGSYDVVVVTEMECNWDLSFQLEEPDGLILQLEGVNLRCQEESTGKIIIQEISGGTGQLSLYMNGNVVSNPGSEIAGLESGFYSLILSDENGCQLSEEVQISQATPGDIELYVDVTEVVVGDSVELVLISRGINGFDEIIWYGPDGTCLDCSEWVVYPKEGSTEYLVIAKDENGCVYDASVIIEASSQFFVPNTFTPDGDQLNDFFTLFSDRSVEVIEQFNVYNRWGELVHSRSNVLPGQSEGAWDGTFNGQMLNPGVFVYYMKLKDKAGKAHVLSGDVTLLR